MSAISLGLAGISCETTFEIMNAIGCLPRYHLAGIYDSCYAELESLTKEKQIRSYGSFRQLATCQNVDGLIWTIAADKIAPDRLGLGIGAKHLLICHELVSKLNEARILELHRFALAHQMEIVPALIHRWTPTTLRLRELIATCLGPIRAIEFQRPVSMSCPKIFRTLDWLRTLVVGHTIKIESSSPDRLSLQFHQFQDSIVEVSILHDCDQSQMSENDEQKETLLICQSGQAKVLSQTEIHWQQESDWTEEHLDGDRHATHVALDLFGRRIAGGIVPVPDLLEVYRSKQLVQQVKNVQQTGVVATYDEASLSIDDIESSL